MKAKVYFSKQITPEKVVELYKAVGLELPGKVAVKVHSGEPGNQNFLTPPSLSATPPIPASATRPSPTAAR